MFNRTFIQPIAPAPSVHIHNETKPHDPADDAARLYGQLRDKAQREVAEATVTRFGADNELTAVVVHTDYDYMNDQPRARVLFRLNGSLYDLKLEPDSHALAQMLYREVATKLVESIMLQVNRNFQLKSGPKR